MAFKRIMPCLLFDGRALVKTVQFRNPKYIGDPINAIRIFNEKEVDELVMLDINASREHRQPRFDLLRDCASECFMPFSYGGGVASLDDFARLYKLGVEKVVVNTLCLTHPEVVAEAARVYGSSSVMAAVDYKRRLLGGYRVYSASGASTRRSLTEHCRFVAEDLGVGEVFLSSVDRDGTWQGYDVETIKEIAGALNVPVIASGGAGSIAQIRQVLEGTSANAAAIGSMAVYQKRGMGVLISFPERRLVFDHAPT
jgi:cyclase